MHAVGRASLGAHLLESVRFELTRLKDQGEKAIGQVPDDAALEHAPDPESNSIGVLVRHLSGPSWRSLSIPRGQSAGPWSYKKGGEGA